MGEKAPTLQECEDASYSAPDVHLDWLKDRWICVKVSPERHYAEMHVKRLPGDGSGATLFVRVWDANDPY